MLYGPPPESQSDISLTGQRRRASSDRQKVAICFRSGVHRYLFRGWWVAGWWASTREGEDLGAVVGDGDGVLEVGGAAAVDGDDGPAVVEHLGLGGARVHHRLDGEHVPLLELHAPARRPVVGDLWVLVHGGADAVAYVLTHHGEARPFGDALDR